MASKKVVSKATPIDYGVEGLYSKRGYFYYQGSQRNGVRPRAVSLRTKDLAEAIMRVAEIKEKERHGAALGGSSGALRMDDLIPIYVEERTATKAFSPKSGVNATVMLTHVSKLMENPCIGQITQNRLIKFRMQLHDMTSKRGRPLSDSSVTTYLVRLKGFFTWCVERGHVRVSPFEGMVIPRATKTRISEFSTIEERDAMLAGPCDEEIATIIRLGYFAGLRYGEIVSLRWMHVKQMPDDRSVIQIQKYEWFTPKGKQARTVPVPDVLQEYLQGIRKPSAKETDYVVAPNKPWLPKHAKGYRFNPKKSFAKHAKACGVKWHITYHHLRHSYITHHMSRGTSLSMLSQWTGDTVEVLVSNYAGFYPNQESVNAIA